jgi:hypothetical protein
MEKRGLSINIAEAASRIARGQRSREIKGKASAEAALQNFDDAFLALKAVGEGAAYHIAEQTFPHRGQWRYQGLPRDAFHVACIAHKTRLKNDLSRRLLLPYLIVQTKSSKTYVPAFFPTFLWL